MTGALGGERELVVVISEAARRRPVQQGDLLEVDRYVEPIAQQDASRRSNRRFDSANLAGIAVISLMVVVQTAWLTALVLALLRLRN
jgi:hypothetical protein